MKLATTTRAAFAKSSFSSSSDVGQEIFDQQATSPRMRRFKESTTSDVQQEEHTATRNEDIKIINIESTNSWRPQNPSYSLPSDRSSQETCPIFGQI
jgi:hypothetical protein